MLVDGLNKISDLSIKSFQKFNITSEQYTSVGRIPPYNVGMKASMLGFDYRKRVLKLLDKVTKELSSNGTPPM